MSDAELARRLGVLLATDGVLANAKQLGRYRRGKKNPSGTSLTWVEQFYAGTKMFFDSGPWFSYLWQALDPDAHPQDALTAIESIWQKAIHIENEITVSGEKAIQDVVIPSEIAACP